jgi:hypothetical protein
MKTTRRSLHNENTQLRAQLAAAHPESRKNLKARLAETRADNIVKTTALDNANATIAILTAKVESLIPPTPAKAA